LAGSLTVLAILSTLAPDLAHAQACVQSNGNYPDPSGRNDYRINIGSFNAELGLHTAATIMAVGLAQSTWTQNGRSGYFLYDGSTDFEGDGDFCNATTGWNLVTMVDHGDCASARGFVKTQCNGTRWWMNVCPRDNWSTFGDPGSGEIDMIQTMAHEFGHLTKLGHPGSTFCSTGGAVMCPTASSNQLTRQRDLYPWDVECSFDFAAARDLDVISIQQTGGVFSSPVTVPPSGSPPSGAYRGHPAARWSGGTPYWSRVVHRDTTTETDTRMTSYLGITSTATARTANVGLNSHTPSMVWWPEESSDIRSIYQRPTSSTKSWTQTYGARQSIYPFDLSASANFQWLQHCTNGSTPCSSAIVRTGHRIAHAWNDDIDQSMTAWVHQNRLTNSSDREVRITHDVLSATLLSQPAVPGVQSSVPPVLACKNGQAAEGYDCILAYVAYNEQFGHIRHRYFSVAANGTYTWRNNEMIDGSATYSGMALWHQDGYWWRAYNHNNTSNVIIHKSADGLSWSFVTHHGLSVQAPAAVSTFTGYTNHLFLTR
jgi:hypothetical protein